MMRLVALISLLFVGSANADTFTFQTDADETFTLRYEASDYGNQTYLLIEGVKAGDAESQEPEYPFVYNSVFGGFAYFLCDSLDLGVDRGGAFAYLSPSTQVIGFVMDENGVVSGGLEMAGQSYDYESSGGFVETLEVACGPEL